ncbi:Tn3 family transposase [Streptomyces antibioticus]|uniref:Tn3 family transposase n=1 Tax=Streptomyces antibioticus TaxID=1890 RepID=UPI0033E74D96
MASLERTAYPRFKRLISERELREFFTPSAEEVAWARERTHDRPGRVLALLVMLKSAARLGRVPKLGEIPEVVVAHVRDQAALAVGTVPETDSERSEERYRSAVRERLELKHKPGEARAVAEAAMRSAAPVKAHTADLVNVALEELVRHKERLELPAFSTLDRMAARIRSEVEGAQCEAIVARMSDAARERVAGMLEVVGGEYQSLFAWIKQPARRATWSRFRAHAERMERVDGLGDAVFWVGKTPPAKVAALAEQARVLSVGEMKDVADPRRTAMTVCLLAQVQAAVRDETVVMLSKRMSRHLKRAQEELLEIEKRQKETTDQLLATFRDVLTALRGSGEAAPGAWEGEASLDDLLALKNARAAIAAAGGFEAQMAELEALDAYRGSNYTALVERFFKPDRPTMFKIARRLSFTATSTERSVLDALDHVLAHQHLTRPLVADTHPTRRDENGESVRLDLSFAPKMWLKTVYSREQPGMLVRRHFEAMVFACLVEELRCGDVAVIGAEDYGDWTRMLLPWEQCEPKLAGFCEQAGIPATASEFTVRLRERLTTIAETVDAGYPDNKDLTINPVTGVPSLALRRAGERTASAEKLEEALSERLPARSVLEHLARAAHWTHWWKRPGPRSGSEPKLKEPLPRYVTTAFVYGSGLGPAQAVRHMRGSVTAHEIGAIAKRHFTIPVLNRCGADVVNAHAGLDLTATWGDGSVAAVDGTMMDTVIDNLLAETSIRYGGYGGIAHHLVSDTYVALFSRFIPCGVWEAVYLIDALLANESEVRPDTVHADTQGQSFPVFGLAHLLGIDLLPRIRNFQDLTFHRPDPQVRYRHIDALFSTDPRTCIDWQLIENGWKDVIQVGLSVREGTVSSVTLLRRLNNHSRKNQIYRVFREVGRAVRTIVLLRYLSDPLLREQITRATNKAEAYNGYTKWLHFGGDGYLRSRDPELQEKAVKFLDLMANSIIFSTTVDMTDTLRQMAAQGWKLSPDDIAALSPHRRDNVLRFGDYDTATLHIPPSPYDSALNLGSGDG